jgi:hypothetical protein
MLRRRVRLTVIRYDIRFRKAEVSSPDSSAKPRGGVVDGRLMLGEPFEAAATTEAPTVRQLIGGTLR